ncbi:MAG TPA: glycoside hydrolase family 172 protein [Verrucomicrobiae bacterium]|nr:glycoside hydrolase family 172 protein [Verrucomicrobiae bacterium]
MNSSEQIRSDNSRPNMDRRGFVTSLAAIGATAALPGIAAAAESNNSAGEGNAFVQTENALRMATLRDQTTRQLTTFNLKQKSKTLSVPRGKRVTIGEVKGEGHIAQFWMTFPGWFWQHWNTKAPVNQSILKTLILRIYFDDAQQPSVETPVGDFFGAGLCEIASFASLYFGTSSGGFFCKWPMPFRKNFRVEVENRDAEIDTDVFCNLLYQLAPLPDAAGYFHAQFNTGFNQGPDPVQIAGAKGRGHYAGCQLYMQGEERNYISFLEAPEYVYIDGDWKTPRFTGTGLEDYFLGGWYFREGTLAAPYHGVPIKDTLNASVAMYRVHENDAIHFKERLKFAFVNPWSPDRLKPFCYSSVAFLYLDKPDGQGSAIPSAKDLMCWYRIRNTDHQSIP